MGLTNFPNGVASFGVPVIQTDNNYPIPGDVYFVCSVASSKWVIGANSPENGTIDRPFATIAYAISRVTANQGDVIYVLPGHTEAIAAAGGITVNKAGISIIGLGTGLKRPTITYSATASTFIVSANNVTIDNIYFNSTGIDAVAAPIVLSSTGGGTTFKNCEHYFAATGLVSLLGMNATTAVAANYLTIDGCYLHGDAAANCTNYLQLVGGDSIKITNNYIKGNFTTSLGCINNITAAVTNILIANNTLINATAVATKVVVLLTTQTGAIVNNRCGIGNGAAPFTADASHWAGNWSASAVATNGTLV